MTTFAPVWLPEDRSLDHKVSATFLRHFNMCARSGFLYQRYKGEAATPAMERGSAFHAVRERATAACVERNEPMIPPGVVKVILDEALCEFHVPVEDHDYLREAVYRWAAETAVDPSTVLANETLFQLQVGPWMVRCKIDFAAAFEDGAVVEVEDHKTARAMVSYEDIARKRPDGSFAAKNMQLVLYALVLAYGVPVRVEECDRCEGYGLMDLERPEPAKGSIGMPCPTCEGDGRVETPEPFPVAARAQEFRLAFVYPGIEDSEGHMARRTVTLRRSELEEYRASLDGLIARVAGCEATGDWPAQTSDEGCGICPARSECPIPREVRDHRGTINTDEEASEAAERLAWEKDDHRARTAELKAWAKTHGPVRFGADRVMDFTYGESERWDRDGLVAAARRHAQYGEPFDHEEFVKRSASTRFGVRTLTAAELDEEAVTDKTESST